MAASIALLRDNGGVMLRPPSPKAAAGRYSGFALSHLGIESSPAFVRAPEGNGCAERFIRTLKKNLLWVRYFKTIEELRQALLAFRERWR